MLIYLDSSLIEFFQSGSFSEEDIETLEDIIASHRNRKHYIYASRSDLDYLSTFTELNKSSKKQISILLHDYTTDKIAINRIQTRINVVSQSKSFKRLDTLDVKNIVFKNHTINKTIFDVPLCQFRDSEFLNKTMLISEHIDDCSLYEFFGKYYIKKNKMPFESKFEYVHGGGQTTANVLQNKISDKYVSLTIADSDKKYPEDNFGETAKRILRCYAKNKDKSIIGVEILPFHEKENLLPLKLYNLFGTGIDNLSLAQLQKINDSDLGNIILPYLDLKKGLHNKNYHHFFSDIFNIPREIKQSHESYNSFLGTKEEFFETTTDQTQTLSYLVYPLGKNPIGGFEFNAISDEIDESLMNTSISDSYRQVLLERKDVLENIDFYLNKAQYEYIQVMGQQVAEWGLTIQNFA